MKHKLLKSICDSAATAEQPEGYQPCPVGEKTSPRVLALIGAIVCAVVLAGCESVSETQQTNTVDIFQEETMNYFIPEVQKLAAYDPYSNQVHYDANEVARVYSTLLSRVSARAGVNVQSHAVYHDGIAHECSADFNWLYRGCEAGYAQQNSSAISQASEAVCRRGWVAIRAGYTKDNYEFGSYEVPVLVAAQGYAQNQSFFDVSSRNYSGWGTFKISGKRPGK